MLKYTSKTYKKNMFFAGLRTILWGRYYSTARSDIKTYFDQGLAWNTVFVSKTPLERPLLFSGHLAVKL